MELRDRLWWLAVAVSVLAAGTIKAQARPDSGFADWARSRAVSLGAVADTAAVPGLLELVRPARVIGMGESVHNVREFLLLRNRLLQQLVRAGVVSALVLESGLPEGRAIDAYVTGQTDSVDFAIGLTYGFGRFEEVRQGIRWLRAWNLGPGRARPVRVFGIDLPASAGSILPALDPVLALLDRADSAESGRLRRAFRPLAARAVGAHGLRAIAEYEKLTPAEKGSLRAEADRLTSTVTRRRAGLIRIAGVAEYHWAVRLAEVVRQTETVFRLGAYHPSNSRDQAMTANTLWVLGRQPAGSKILLWAHNAHVQRVPITGPSSPAKMPVPSIGSILAGRLGAGYRAIGTSYGGPSLDSATSVDPGGIDRALGDLDVAAPLLLDLSRAPKTGSVGRWLARPRPIRFQVGHLLVPLGQAFDAIAYFDQVEPAKG